MEVVGGSHPEEMVAVAVAPALLGEVIVEKIGGQESRTTIYHLPDFGVVLQPCWFFITLLQAGTSRPSFVADRITLSLQNTTDVADAYAADSIGSNCAHRVIFVSLLHRR